MAQSMRLSLKMLLLYLVEWAWRNALYIFFIIRDRRFLSWHGGMLSRVFLLLETDDFFSGRGGRGGGRG